jgi:hypothetical protein
MPFQWQSTEIVPARNLQHALSLNHGGFGGGGFHGGFGGGGGCGALPHPIANGTPNGTMAAGYRGRGGAGAPAAVIRRPPFPWRHGSIKNDAGYVIRPRVYFAQT